MADEKSKKLAEEALARLTAELEQGKSEALTRYLSTMARFHRYSWNNALLIHAQRSHSHARRGVSDLARAGALR
jgi:hypothetical protein